MTNEEREKAIVIMENERPHCGRRITFTEEEKCEAFDMAIAALKAEPCEDCVSRETVIAVLDWHEHEKSEIESYIREIAEDIKALPSVTPKQKTGKWIQRHIIGSRNIEMTVCSECGEEFSYDAETGVSEYNFCPNCGAKMGGE